MRHHKLIEVIAENYRLSDNEVQLINDSFEYISVSKNTIVEQENKVPKCLYYIVSGYVRLFHHNENGDEITSHINSPTGFIASYFNFLNQTISNENIECITDTNLLSITKPALDILLSSSVNFKNYNIEMLNKALIFNENRAKELATLSAEQRYIKLLQNQPNIIQNVPLQYIASFLGIKPESLSRIRKKIIS